MCASRAPRSIRSGRPASPRRVLPAEVEVLGGIVVLVDGGDLAGLQVDPLALAVVVLGESAVEFVGVRRVRESGGVGVDVIDPGVSVGGAAARDEPLVELVAEDLGSGGVGAVGLAEPVEEVRLVVGTEKHLVHRLAVDDFGLVAPLLVGLAVDEVARVTRLTLEVGQPDEPLSSVAVEVVQGSELAAVGEHRRLVEAPPAEPDTHFRHYQNVAGRRIKTA